MEHLMHMEHIKGMKVENIGGHMERNNFNILLSILYGINFSMVYENEMTKIYKSRVYALCTKGLLTVKCEDGLLKNCRKSLSIQGFSDFSCNHSFEGFTGPDDRIEIEWNTEMDKEQFIPISLKSSQVIKYK